MRRVRVLAAVTMLGLLLPGEAPRAANGRRHVPVPLDQAPAFGFNAVWSDGRGSAWAVGDAGVAARTTDGGRSWRRASVPSRGALTAVWGAARGSVFVAGVAGLALRSANDGRSWQRLALDHQIVSTLEYDKTADGLEFRGVWGTRREVFFVGGESGAGAAICLRAPLDATRLGRRVPCEVDDPKTIWGRAGAMFILGTIYDCHDGDYDVVDRSSDSGGHWTRPRLELRVLPTRFWMTEAGVMYALTTDGTVLRSTDEFASATNQVQRSTGRRFEHRAIWAGSNGELFIVGEGYRILHSQDDGKTFDELEFPVR